MTHTTENSKEVLREVVCKYCGEIIHTFSGEKDRQYLEEYPDSSADWIRELKFEHEKECPELS